MKSMKNRKFTKTLGKAALLFSTSLMALYSNGAIAQETTTQTAADADVIIVLGSRIPRVNKEGPAPVTVINADQIAASGYGSVPEILRSVTQNGGETQGQQSGTGAITTPGASQVDLRGLGPNHTLVMINGHRIADFPMPFRGLSNFTDISSIPTSMVDRIEILSGSASAIYGSDAISGVINFNLKKKPDGTTISYRYGDTADGGGRSDRLTLYTGYEKDRFSIVVGAEYFNQEPLWGYERTIQDSNLDSPYARTQRAEYIFGEYDWDYDAYTDPGSSSCDNVDHLFSGTVSYTSNYWDEYYCGSFAARGLNTILHDKESFNAIASLNYELSDKTKLFADIQIGTTKVALMRSMPDWAYQDENGNVAYYYNQATGIYGSYERTFSPEEAGGVGNGMNRNSTDIISITPGIKSSFGDNWNYELSLNYSRAKSTMKLPMIVASLANDFFLGPNLGTAESPEFDAPNSGFYRALTTTEYNSISEISVTNAENWTFGGSFTLTKDDLFKAPAGDVGFALIAEVDGQGYEINPNANATDFGYYYGYAATSGKGDRTHEGIGVEFKVPLLETLEVALATRYDAYQFADSDIGKLTYNLGLEYRPISSLLVRAAYGTGFRAPDLHYVFAKPDLFHPTIIDNYQCRMDGGSDCEFNDSYEYDSLKIREGSSDLKPEESESFNVGFVWQPSRNFDISVDYFNVKLNDEVQDMQIADVLRDEASCRIGTTESGASVNPSSASCISALSRVVRYTSGSQAGNVRYVYISPINVSEQTTDGIDIEAHLTIPTSYGKYRFSIGHTEVFSHEITMYEGDATVDMLAADSGYYMPSQKSNASASLEYGPLTFTLSATRLGQIPNWFEDEYISESYKYNSNITWEVNDHATVSFSINNLTDEEPVKDPTYRSYPYYDISWFDSIGRSYYLDLKYKF